MVDLSLDFLMAVEAQSAPRAALVLEEINATGHQDLSIQFLAGIVLGLAHEIVDPQPERGTVADWLMDARAGDEDADEDADEA